MSHIARHGVVPEEAEDVVRSAGVVAEGVRQGEPRVVAVGETSSGKTLVAVFTKRR